MLAQLQRRPHPGDDVPLRSALPARKPAARALGCRRLPVSRRSGGQLHQAAGGPARRDDSHLPWRHLCQTAWRRRLTRLARKPLRHQAAMQIAVYDDRHQPRRCPIKPEWQRWACPNGGWGLIERGVSRYQTKQSSDEWAELRYRHLVPEPDQWDAVLDGRALPREPARHADHRFLLVQHQHGRRVVESSRRDAARARRGVDAAALGGRLDASGRSGSSDRRAPASRSVSSWSRRGIAHRCTIDLATGTAVVTRGDIELGRFEQPSRERGVITSISQTSTTG